MGSIQSNNLPAYKIDDQIETYGIDFWTVSKGSFNNYKNATIFVHNLENNKKSDYTYALNQIKALKTLRHPNIVKYLYSFEQPQLSSCYLICESICSLKSVLNDFTNEQILCGLHGITCAIDFLHNKAFISHNNINEDNIYVNTKFLWKLNSFELSLNFADMNLDNLNRIKEFKNTKTLTPEETTNTEIEPQYRYCIDVYGWSDMCLNLINTKNDEISKDFNLFLNKNYKLRPNITRAFELNIFKLNENLKNNEKLLNNEDIEAYLNELVNKNDENLINEYMIDYLLSPSMFFSIKIRDNLLPFVLIPKYYDTNKKNFIYYKNTSLHSSLSTSPSSISSTTQLVPFINDDKYKAYVVPRIINLFTIKILPIRLTLLKYFPFYFHLINNLDTLKYELLPEILLGLKDDNDELVSLTFICLSVMVKLLGSNVVVGINSRSDKQRIFSNNSPKFNNSEIEIPKIDQTYSLIKTLSDNYADLDEIRKKRTSESVITLNDFDLATNNNDIEDDQQDLDSDIDVKDNSWSNDFNWESATSVKNENQQTSSIPIIMSNINKIQIKEPTVFNNDEKYLGAEYDIKSVNIKVKTVKTLYDDIFEDMQPVIETTKKHILPDETKSKTAFNYEVKDEVPVSWGDDADQIDIDTLIIDDEQKTTI